MDPLIATSRPAFRPGGRSSLSPSPPSHTQWRIITTRSPYSSGPHDYPKLRLEAMSASTKSSSPSKGAHAGCITDTRSAGKQESHTEMLVSQKSMSPDSSSTQTNSNKADTNNDDASSSSRQTTSDTDRMTQRTRSFLNNRKIFNKSKCRFDKSKSESPQEYNKALYFRQRRQGVSKESSTVSDEQVEVEDGVDDCHTTPEKEIVRVKSLSPEKLQELQAEQKRDEDRQFCLIELRRRKEERQRDVLKNNNINENSLQSKSDNVDACSKSNGNNEDALSSTESSIHLESSTKPELIQYPPAPPPSHPPPTKSPTKGLLNSSKQSKKPINHSHHMHIIPTSELARHSRDLPLHGIRHLPPLPPVK